MVRASISASVSTSVEGDTMKVTYQDCGAKHAKVSDMHHNIFEMLQLDATRPIIVGYHGGCPDGCGAALLMQRAIEEEILDANVELVAISHQANKFSKVVRPGCIVFSLDITPSLEDVDQLRLAHKVVIIDHHADQKKIHDALKIELPNLVNWSDLDGKECGVSLVRDLVKDIIEID